MEFSSVSCFTSVFALGGLATLLFGLWRRRQHKRKLADWRVAYAEIVDLSAPDVIDTNLDSPPHMAVTYEYQADGRTHRAQEGSALALLRADRYEVGDTAEVYVNPDDPTDATLDQPEARPSLPLLLSGAGMLLLAIADPVLQAIANLGWSGGFWESAGLFVIMPGFAFMMLYFGRKQYLIARESTSWPTTRGEVVYSGVKKQEGGGESDAVSYGPAIFFDYEVRGQTYRSHRISSSGFISNADQSRAERKANEYPVGSQVTVYYDPDDPEFGVLEPGDTTGPAMMIGFGLLMLVMNIGLLVERF